MIITTSWLNNVLITLNGQDTSDESILVKECNGIPGNPSFHAVSIPQIVVSANDWVCLLGEKCAQAVTHGACSEDILKTLALLSSLRLLSVVIGIIPCLTTGQLAFLDNVSLRPASVKHLFPWTLGHHNFLSVILIFNLFMWWFFIWMVSYDCYSELPTHVWAWL